MFGRIFNPENAFFRTADKLADLVMLSLMWALCSIPLVTLGPATAALYDAAVKILRRGEAGNIYQRFFHSFRLNFKVGALTSLAVLAAAVLLFLFKNALEERVLLYGLGNFLYRLALTGKAGVVLYYAYLLLLLLPIGMISYLFPVLSRFTFGAGGLIGTCWKLALNHLPSTLLLGLLTAAAAWACLSFWIPVLVLPAVAALLASLPLERIFRPYLELPGGGETEE